MKKIIKPIIHFIFRSRKVEKEIKVFAKGVYGKKILEIGSGHNPSKRFFDSSNNFTMSDLNPENSEYIKLNICDMNFKEKYDLIICINVLDDVFDYEKSIKNIYNALKKDGEIFLITPGFYPLHDIPNDYWRFSEFALRKIFSKFKEIKINRIGMKNFPSYYITTAKK